MSLPNMIPILLLLIFSHFYVGSMCLMRRLNLALSSRSCCCPTNSVWVFLSLFSPSPPSPSLSYLRISLLFSVHVHTISTYFPALSWICLPPSFLSFLIMSSLVTPFIHLNILISATSNFFSCVFFTAQVSAPHIIAGLKTVLYTFHLT